MVIVKPGDYLDAKSRADYERAQVRAVARMAVYDASPPAMRRAWDQNGGDTPSVIRLQAMGLRDLATAERVVRLLAARRGD
jgi:hypothetical protein